MTPPLSAMQRWLQQNYLVKETLIRLSRMFSAQQPFPHIAFNAFLPLQQATALRSALLQETFTEKESDLFSLHQTADLHNSSHQTMQAFIQFLESTTFRTFLEHLTGKKLARPIDISGSAYMPTNHLLPHNDLVEGRALAFSYYLTPNFSAQEGGTLQLFSTVRHIPSAIVRSYPPTFNTLIIFTVSADSFHQVAEVVGEKERLAVSGWFHEKR